MGIPTVSFQVLEGSQAGTLVQELVGGPWVVGFVVGLGGLGEESGSAFVRVMV